MITFRYKTFNSSEEFEEWQGKCSNIAITQLSPILLEMVGNTKTNKVEKGMENSSLVVNSLPYGIFIVYYLK